MPVMAPGSGVIEEFYVQNGDTVKAGQKLLRLKLGPGGAKAAPKEEAAAAPSPPPTPAAAAAPPPPTPTPAAPSPPPPPRVCHISYYFNVNTSIIINFKLFSLQHQFLRFLLLLSDTLKLSKIRLSRYYFFLYENYWFFDLYLIFIQIAASTQRLQQRNYRHENRTKS